jgi:hypothetical protein
MEAQVRQYKCQKAEHSGITSVKIKLEKISPFAAIGQLFENC